MHRTCSWLFGVSASILEESGTNVYILYMSKTILKQCLNIMILVYYVITSVSSVVMSIATRVVLVKLFEIWTLRCLLEVGVIQ